MALQSEQAKPSESIIVMMLFEACEACEACEGCHPSGGLLVNTSRVLHVTGTRVVMA
jgi:hypothetical protein